MAADYGSAAKVEMSFPLVKVERGAPTAPMLLRGSKRRGGDTAPCLKPHVSEVASHSASLRAVSR
jgi:hypothetical protein